jgi:hypothetical protein
MRMVIGFKHNIDSVQPSTEIQILIYLARPKAREHVSE